MGGRRDGRPSGRPGRVQMSLIDSERSVEPSELQRQVSESSSRSVRSLTRKKSADIGAGRRSTAT